MDRYYTPICLEHGRQPYEVGPRDLTPRCTQCSRLLDHFAVCSHPTPPPSPECDEPRQAA